SIPDLGPLLITLQPGITEFPQESTFREVSEEETSANDGPGEMILVNKGIFQMGNTRGDSEGDTDEFPVQDVTLTYDYLVGQYEVTFGEYDAYCEETGKSKPGDSGWGRENRPVINVNWYDALGYCNWMSEREGLAVAYDSEGNLLDSNGQMTSDITQVEGYRLPTEAEWEYAARGGSQATGDWRFAGSDELDEVGWYEENSGNKTHLVGEKKANELGLYDMSGNVWEWCHDRYASYQSGNQQNPLGPEDGAFRCARGGSWRYTGINCRIASRRYDTPPSSSFNHMGFRLARTYTVEENRSQTPEEKGFQLVFEESFDSNQISEELILTHGMGSTKHFTDQGVAYYQYSSYSVPPRLVEKDGRHALLYDCPSRYHGFITFDKVFTENEGRDIALAYDFFLEQMPGENIHSFIHNSVDNDSSFAISSKGDQMRIYSPKNNAIEYFSVPFNFYDAWHHFSMEYLFATNWLRVEIDGALVWEGQLEDKVNFAGRPYFGNGQGSARTYVSKVFYDNLKLYFR
ncbi:MAG TPA: SUMF1/EgtB/PvdO family nonheme iron enzyme, partial [Thermotogota bacterium]|nr:SUMF1/EgtB/PvdO family nonheme iron enzyme [Thermotogota bacterium]